MYLCCSIVRRIEFKVRQNLLASDYEIYMVCLLVATVYWHKSLQYVKKSNITLLPYLFMIFLAVSMTSYALPHLSQIINLLHIIISVPPAPCTFIYLFLILCELTGRLIAMGHVLMCEEKQVEFGVK